MGHDHDHDFDFSFLGDLTEDSSDSGPAEEGESNTWLLDNVELITVGVDVGSSTTHLVFGYVIIFDLPRPGGQ